MQAARFNSGASASSSWCGQDALLLASSSLRQNSRLPLHTLLHLSHTCKAVAQHAQNLAFSPDGAPALTAQLNRRNRTGSHTIVTAAHQVTAGTALSPPPPRRPLDVHQQDSAATPAVVGEEHQQARPVNRKSGYGSGWYRSSSNSSGTSVDHRSGSRYEAQAGGRYEARRLLVQLDAGTLWSQQEASDHVQRLCKTAPWPDVWRLYQAVELSQVMLSSSAYQDVMLAAVREGFVVDAVDVFHRLVAVHGPPDQRVYVTLISRLLHVKRMGVPSRSLALTMWKELQGSGMRLDGASYRMGVNAYVENGKLQDAQQVMEVMRAQGLRPGHGSFNMLIKGYAAVGNMNGARKVLAMMRAYDTRADSYTYNTLLTGFVRVGDLPMARAVLEKSAREGVPPDVCSYSSLLTGYARAHDFAAAEALLVEMVAVGVAPNAVTYGALIDGYLQTGNLAVAGEVVGRMRAAGVVPSRQIYNMLVKGHIRAGDAVAAAAAIDEMRRAGHRPDTATYSTLLHAAVRAGDPASALSAYRAMKEEGCVLDAGVYTTLMKLFKLQPSLVLPEGNSSGSGGGGGVARALAAHEQMSASRYATVDTIALCALVDVHVAAGDMLAAERAARDAAASAAALGRRPPPEAFMALIKGYAKRSSLQPALTAFRTFLTLGGVPPRKMCDRIVRLCYAQNAFRAASQAIRAMQLTGVPVDTLRYRDWLEGGSNTGGSQEQQDGGVQGGRGRTGGAAGSYDDSANGQGGKAQQPAAPGRVGGAASRVGADANSSGLERLKWWLGLPNNYYESDW